MRKFLLLAAVAMLPIPAGAADMPMKANALVPPAPTASGWQGFYLGAHGAYGWGQMKTSVEEIGDFDINRVMFGGQAGYRWQIGAFVPGVEVDFTYAGRSSSKLFEEGDVKVSSKVAYLASARAVLGLAPNNDFLVFITGGPAWAHTQGTIAVGDESAIAPANHFGIVFGAGAEMKFFSNSWTLGAEFLRYQMGKTPYTFSSSVSPESLSLNGELTDNVVRVRLNHRFVPN